MAIPWNQYKIGFIYENSIWEAEFIEFIETLPEESPENQTLSSAFTFKSKKTESLLEMSIWCSERAEDVFTEQTLP